MKPVPHICTDCPLLPQENEFKVNTEDVFRWAQKKVEELKEEVQTLEIQKEEVSVSDAVLMYML